LTDHPWITIIGDWLYLNIQRMSRRLAVRAKRKSKAVLECVEKIRQEAMNYARARCADFVVCGHTHHAEAPPSEFHASPAYFNTGSWTDHHCHYLTFDNGFARLDDLEMEIPLPEGNECEASLMASDPAVASCQN
jgi:UDP-2,3-diacylglucosamine pyrophosphatase LpxH